MHNDLTTHSIPRNRHKRTTSQRAADFDFIERGVLRGLTHQEIADDLAKTRPYKISRSQVSVDTAELRRRWLSSADESFAQRRAKALRVLDEVERCAWQAWECATDTRATNQSALAKVLEVHDRRMKLLGLDAPIRQEISGPAGTPIEIETRAATAELLPEAKVELFRRHLARLERRGEVDHADPSQQGA